MSARIREPAAFRVIFKKAALMMTARWPFEIVPACGFVTTVALVQPRPFPTGHLSHHPKAALHEMARRRLMALYTLPGARRRMNIRLNKPALRTVAVRTVAPEICGMNILDLVARNA